MHGFSDAGYVLAVLVVLAIAVLLVHRYRSFKAATAAHPPLHMAPEAPPGPGAALGAELPAGEVGVGD